MDLLANPHECCMRVCIYIYIYIHTQTYVHTGQKQFGFLEIRFDEQIFFQLKKMSLK